MNQINIKKYTLILIAILIIGISFAFFIALNDRYNQFAENENITANIAYEKDMIYRHWVAVQGGVYVPISKFTPPNLYLTFIENRDIITTDNDSLTLVNPAYMTRQVLEMAEQRNYLSGHLVSLMPINPINTPDAWEKEALLAFEKGDTISIKNEIIDGIEYFRVIRPFLTEQSCLKCHEHQGYKIGDIRGGLSVYVPVDEFRIVLKNNIKRLIINYLVVLIIVVLVVLFIMLKLNKQLLARKIAEEQLAESELKFRSLFAHMSEGFALHEIIYDSGHKAIDYKILTINSAFTKQIGIPEEKANGALATKLYGVSPAPYLDIYSQVAETGKPQYFETYFSQLNKYFDISVFSPSSGHFATIFTDITDRKQSEEKVLQLNHQLNETNATKDKLFSLIAHDLKSPFHSILGFSKLLHENIISYDIEKSKKYIININSTAKHTLILLENLLDWAKSQTGQIDFKPENLRLQQISQETVEGLNSTAFLKNISLNIYSSEDIIVYADPNMLKTVLRNLISNAIKFTNSGGKIDINTVSDQNQIEITVSDNGVGMDEDTRNKLFRIDTNISTPGTAHEKGSGLGLILCKEFVEKHGGIIWVESEVGLGSKFVFTMPIPKT